MRKWFEAGESGAFMGIEWRLCEGKKESRLPNAEDLRLDIKTTGGTWCPVPMSLGFLMADVFFQVEETLYPQGMGFEGGNRYVRYVHRSIQEGHEKPVADLESERKRRRA